MIKRHLPARLLAVHAFNTTPYSTAYISDNVSNALDRIANDGINQGTWAALDADNPGYEVYDLVALALGVMPIGVDE